MNIYYVYAYLRKKDQTPYYIGKGKGNRAYEKSHSVSVPKDKSKIVFYQKNLNEFDAFKLETSYILLFGRKDLCTGILSNRTNGGEGSSDPSKETRNKISKKMTGRNLSKNHKNNISKSLLGKDGPNLGKKQNEEWRNKNSISHKGQLGYWKDKTHSNEHKIKNSLSQIGRKWFNNGKVSIRDYDCPIGFVSGRIPKI